MKTLREYIDLIEAVEQKTENRPMVWFEEIPKNLVFGRDFFKVVKSQTNDWQPGETFSDDDMSMASSQVKFVPANEQDVTEDAADDVAKLAKEFRK